MTQLQEEIDSRRSEIKTDEYAMSIGEIVRLYEDKELDIHPEFQRYFRWDSYQKTRLIESILLGIPIPPIFVAQQPTGVWDVIDGVQRLSTIFQLMGVLRLEDGTLVDKLVLESTKYLPSLKDKVWDDDENTLDSQQRLLIKRSRLNVSIILYDSDPRSKFELFQRLNTGGSPLTDQEVRNSMLVAANRSFYQWLRSLASNAHFQECVPLTERQQSEQYDVELVLRFIIFRTQLETELTTGQIGDLSEYITDKMLKMAEDTTFDYAKEQQAFEHTFNILASETGEDSFKRFHTEKNRFYGPFLLTPYEVVAYGIGYNYQQWDATNSHLIPNIIQSIWTNPTITSNSGSGVRANSRIPIIVPEGRRLFQP